MLNLRYIYPADFVGLEKRTHYIPIGTVWIEQYTVSVSNMQERTLLT